MAYVITCPEWDTVRHVSYTLYFSGEISLSGRILKIAWSTSLDDALYINDHDLFWKVYNCLCRIDWRCGFFVP